MMDMIAARGLPQEQGFLGSTTAPLQGVVAIVSDDAAKIQCLVPVCDFLDLRVEVFSTSMDLAQLLLEHRPMAVISDMDGVEQDGFHAMKIVARHDRDLPVMLLTDGDAVLMGAVDAVQELTGLTSVATTSGFPMAGQLVAFLFSAGRRNGSMRLMPI